MRPRLSATLGPTSKRSRGQALRGLYTCVMGRGQEEKDPFTKVLGTRRGLSPKHQTVGHRTGVWQEEMRHFHACWDLSKTVPSEPWEIIVNTACRALEDLGEALRRGRGRGISMRDVSVTYEEKYQSCRVSLFDIPLGALILTEESSGVGVQVEHDFFAYSPDQFLIFDDDADGELTFVPLMMIHRDVPDREQLLISSKEVRSLCRKEVVRRLKKRIKSGPSDLYDAKPEPMRS